MRHRRHLILTLAALVAGASLAPAALAGDSYPTTIVYDDAEELGNDNWKFTGDIASEKSACVPNRTVKMLKETQSGWKFVDQDQTNSAGRWATKGHLPNEPDLKFKVIRKEIGSGVCEADSIRPFEMR